MIKLRLIIICSLILVTQPSISFAFLSDTLGVGLRAMSLGEAFVAVADNYSAAYYNPAGLGQITDEIKVSMDFIMPFYDFEVTSLDTGQDLKEYDNKGNVKWDPVKGQGGGRLNALKPVLGLSANITKIASALPIPVNVTLGISVCIPDSFKRLINVTDFIPDIPKYTRLGDPDEHIFVCFGVGVEVLKDTLYMGGGANIRILGEGDIHGDNYVVGFNESGQNLVLQLDLDMKIDFAPIVGILYTPFNKKFKIGATYRQETEMSLGRCPIIIELSSSSVDDRLSAYIYPIMDFLFSYAPAEYAIGVAFDINPFTVSIDYEIQKWSGFEYPDHFKHRSYYLSESTLSGIETGGPFDDVANISLGLEYRYNQDLTLMTGYKYMPTPVPDQSGRVSNYLDMDKNVFSFGVIYSLENLNPRRPFKKLPIKLGAMVEYILCDDYRVNNEGVKGWSWEDQESFKVSGDVWIIGFSAEINF